MARRPFRNFPRRGRLGGSASLWGRVRREVRREIGVAPVDANGGPGTDRAERIGSPGRIDAGSREPRSGRQSPESKGKTLYFSHERGFTGIRPARMSRFVETQHHLAPMARHARRPTAPHRINPVVA